MSETSENTSQPGAGQPPAAAKESIFSQPVAVWATAFACVVGFMSIGLVDPILTSIAAAMQASAADVSMLFTTYFLVTSVMMLITGFVSSRIGARWTLLLGAFLIVVFAALAGASNSIPALAWFRAGWGLGNAFFVVTALSVLVAVARGGTGKAVLIYEAAIGLGLSCGPLIGAALGAHSWRYPFFGTATLMGIGFISIAIFLPHLPKPAQKVSLTAPVRALGHPGLFTVSLAGLFYFFAFFTVLAFAPFVLDMSAHAVGLIFFGWGLLLAISSVFLAPRVEARWGLVKVATGCLITLAVLLLIMGVAPKSVLAVCVVLSGAVMGICNTLFTELALEVSDAPRGVASAGYNFLRWFAGVIAPFAVPRLAEHFGVFPAFGVAALAAIIAPLILLARRGHLAKHAAVEASAVAPVCAAVDGSASDALVLDRAIMVARALKAPVMALHVRMREVFDEGAQPLESREEAAAVLEAAKARIEAAGIEARVAMVDAAAGLAARRVAQQAMGAGASHLVLGARHADDPGDRVHGSFAEAIAASGNAMELVVVPEVKAA